LGFSGNFSRYLGLPLGTEVSFHIIGLREVKIKKGMGGGGGGKIEKSCDVSFVMFLSEVVTMTT